MSEAETQQGGNDGPKMGREEKRDEVLGQLVQGRAEDILQDIVDGEAAIACAVRNGDNLPLDEIESYTMMLSDGATAMKNILEQSGYYEEKRADSESARSEAEK